MIDQTPVQIAWVTRDLDATEKALTMLLGAKKWMRMPGVHFGPDTCTYRGKPADFVADISLSYAGETQLELIAPVSGESIYTEFLDRAGPGLHHICVEVDDLEEASQRGVPERGGCAAWRHGRRNGVRLRHRRGGRGALHRNRALLARDPGVLRLCEAGAESEH